MGALQSVAYDIRWNIGAGLVTMPGALGAELTLEMTEGESGLGWGTAATPRASIRATAATAAAAWQLGTVQVRLGLNGGALQDAFTGPLMRRADDGIAYRYEAAGWDVLIQRTRVRMPTRQRRAIATRTTLTSNEDPASPSCRSGLINEVFWRCGGRPWEQRGNPTYSAEARFWYRCDGSSIAPEYGAVDGENPWEELLALAEAGGGRIYQDAAGTMCYVNPLALAESAASPPLLNESVYRRLTCTESVEGVVSTALASFKRLAAQVEQEVYSDTTPKSVPAGASRDFDLAQQWPILSYGRVEVAAGLADGVKVTPTVVTLDSSSMLYRIRVTNPSSTRALVIDRISLWGSPVTTITEGLASFAGTASGPFATELRLPSNLYIQSEGDARRWARMAVRFFGQSRPTYIAESCPYNPLIIPGVYVLLSNTRRGLSSVPCRVTRVAIAASGKEQTVAVVPLTGLPKLSDFFVCGRAYAGADIRRYGY